LGASYEGINELMDFTVVLSDPMIQNPVLNLYTQLTTEFSHN